MQKNQDLILTLKQLAISGYEKYKPQFLALEKGYLALIDKDVERSLKYRGKSTISPKRILAKVRKLETNILKTYFSNDTLAQIEIDGDKELGEILQSELNELANAKLKLYTKLRPLIRDLLVYGTSVAKVYFSPAKNSVEVRYKKLNEVLIDPNARDFDDVKFIIDRFYMSLADIKKNYKTKLKGLNLSANNGEMMPNQSNDLGDYTRVQVYEIYRVVDDRWCVSTCIDDYFIRSDYELKNGLPFIFAGIYPQFIGLDEKDAVASYGASYIEPLIEIQEQISITRNQQMDAIFQQLNPRFLVNKTSGIRDDDLANQSLRKVVVTNLEQIKELSAPRINESIFEVGKLDDELSEISGLSKLNQGMSSQTDPKSATGMSILAQSGNELIDDVVRSFNESFFEPFVRKIVKLIYANQHSNKFVGFDRSKKIGVKVIINAGVGSTTIENKLNNFSSAKQSLLTAIDIAAKSGFNAKVKEYFGAFDKSLISELSLMGQKNIKESINEGINDEQERELKQRELAEQARFAGIPTNPAL